MFNIKKRERHAFFFLLIFIILNAFAFNGSFVLDKNESFPEEKEKKRGESHPFLKKRKININEAEMKILMNVPGIGRKTAHLIIERRKKEKYLQIEDLIELKGIGKRKLSHFRNYLCVQNCKFTDK